jgi:hypothetical protein
MAASDPIELPAVLFQLLDEITCLHSVKRPH